MRVGISCAAATGGNPQAMIGCLAKELPPNTIAQCSANPRACFGPLSPLTLQVQIGVKLAEKIGVNIPKLAEKADRLWGKVKKIF
jgi:hypothetical protein